MKNAISGTRDLPEDYWTSLGHAKAQAVTADDQDLAKAAWCLETIGSIQDSFVGAFRLLRAEEFKAAWDAFERCEIDLSFVGRHFSDEANEFGLQHIRGHVPTFQSIFPYKWGVSPAMLYKRVTCSVCHERITLRSDCGHEVGEIYNGEMCHRSIEKVELLHVSFVDRPAQKYSVFELASDHPGFELVRYVVQGLRTPWDQWSCEREERREHHPAFKALGRNDPCPCNSGRKYKRCCLTSDTVYPHFDIQFEHDLPTGMSHFVKMTPSDS